ncbi:hypothetical protein B0I37DRAFT_419503 [Chaetomium sp. MPI-CAGE-AT-0009]|nr:hypothetical protein B0I37DRAFT_419503 [Chaetomium sp. MPI-CAGE-AT-0009]
MRPNWPSTNGWENLSITASLLLAWEHGPNTKRESEPPTTPVLGLSNLQASSPNNWLACDPGLVFINPPPAPPTDYQTTTYFWLDHASDTLRLSRTWY